MAPVPGNRGIAQDACRIRNQCLDRYVESSKSSQAQFRTRQEVALVLGIRLTLSVSEERRSNCVTLDENQLGHFTNEAFQPAPAAQLTGTGIEGQPSWVVGRGRGRAQDFKCSNDRLGILELFRDCLN